MYILRQIWIDYFFLGRITFCDGEIISEGKTVSRLRGGGVEDAFTSHQSGQKTGE